MVEGLEEAERRFSSRASPLERHRGVASATQGVRQDGSQSAGRLGREVGAPQAHSRRCPARTRSCSSTRPMGTSGKGRDDLAFAARLGGVGRRARLGAVRGRPMGGVSRRPQGGIGALGRRDRSIREPEIGQGRVASLSRIRRSPAPPLQERMPLLSLRGNSAGRQVRCCCARGRL